MAEEVNEQFVAVLLAKVQRLEDLVCLIFDCDSNARRLVDEINTEQYADGRGGYPIGIEDRIERFGGK